MKSLHIGYVQNAKSVLTFLIVFVLFEILFLERELCLSHSVLGLFLLHVCSPMLIHTECWPALVTVHQSKSVIYSFPRQCCFRDVEYKPYYIMQSSTGAFSVGTVNSGIRCDIFGFS